MNFEFVEKIGALEDEQKSYFYELLAQIGRAHV